MKIKVTYIALTFFILLTSCNLNREITNDNLYFKKSKYRIFARSTHCGKYSNSIGIITCRWFDKSLKLKICGKTIDKNVNIEDLSIYILDTNYNIIEAGYLFHFQSHVYDNQKSKRKQPSYIIQKKENCIIVKKRVRYFAKKNLRGVIGYSLERGGEYYITAEYKKNNTIYHSDTVNLIVK
jgi:hypothetical protein